MKAMPSEQQNREIFFAAVTGHLNTLYEFVRPSSPILNPAAIWLAASSVRKT
jgi:hypothetical protein